MATNKTQNNSKRSPTPAQQTPRFENTTPPQPTPLQYDDPQRFRDYAHAIDFNDDTFSTNDMFANPTPLPQLEISGIISAAEQLQQQQTQSYPPARGTGLGKTESRPPKRVRFDTPQPAREESRGDAVKESLNGEGDRPLKRVRFDMPQADEDKGGVDEVRESSSGELVRPQRSSDEETWQIEHSRDEGNSSDDCAWSVDSEIGDAGEKAQDGTVFSDQDSSVAKEVDQRGVEAGDLSHQS